jgi:hypothetical protein
MFACLLLATKGVNSEDVRDIVERTQEVLVGWILANLGL